MPELTKVRIREVSLVDRPANRQKFALVKSAEGGQQMPTAFGEKADAALEQMLNKADASEETILAKVGDLRKAANAPWGEEELARATLLLRLAGESTLPVEKRAEIVAQMMGGETKPESTKKADTAPPKPIVVPESLADLAKTNAALATVIAKAAETAPETLALLEPLLKQAADDRKEAAELRKAVATLTDTNRNAEALAKADAIGVPGDRTKIAALLRKAEDAGFGADLETLLKANAEQIRKGGLFANVGSSRGGAGSALAQMEELAAGLVAKSADGKLTKAQAFVKIAETNSELYEQYLAEQKGGA